MKNKLRFLQKNARWFFLGTFTPPMFWALYQDKLGQMPWYDALLALTLGGVFGIWFIMKVIDPMNRYIDAKVAKLFGIKIR